MTPILLAVMGLALADDRPAPLAAKPVVFKEASGEKLKLHVFSPPDTKPGDRRTGIVFFFGGAWNSWNPTQFDEYARHFAGKGCVAICAEYRVRSRHMTTPVEAVRDAKSAIRYVRQHAKELGIDPARIVAGGGSAGGHLAACTAIVPGHNDEAGATDADAAPNALVLFNPVVDLVAQRKSDDVKPISPRQHVRAGLPPTLVLHGTADATVPFAQVETFARAMTAAENVCEVAAFDGRGHGFFNSRKSRNGKDGDYPACLAKVTAFLEARKLLPAVAARLDGVSARPNVVWIVVDDMSANFSCYGETAIRTPHVDRLAAEGTRFSRAFVTAPVCSPCRSALITGCYQTTIGAHHHRSGRGELKITLPDEVVPVPVLFRKAGYYTCIGGHGAAGGKLGKTDYNFEWPRDMYDGNDWAGRKPGQPFFMQVQLHGGKHRGQGPNANWQARVRRELGANTKPEDVTLPPYYPRDPVILQDWADYLDCCRFTDKEVGDVLARLEREKLLENTLVVFMTDHGISHARGKQFLYDEGTHVPFVVRGPGVAKGAVRDDLIEHIDLAATSLAAAGIEIPKWVQGRDVLAGGYTKRDAVFAARDRCDETIDHIRSIRTERIKYIRNYLPDRPHLQPCRYKDEKAIVKRLRELHAEKTLDPLAERLLFAEKRPAEELYDLTADRFEVNNLAADAKHGVTLADMRRRLAEWETRTGDQGREPEPMTRYDSEMAQYLGEAKKGADELRRNIERNKKWAAEGK